VAAEALTGHIELMREVGEPVPDPSTLDEVMNNPNFQDGVAFLASLEEPGETVRVNITSPSRNCTRSTSMRGQGMTRSAFGKVGVERLPNRRATDLGHQRPSPLGEILFGVERTAQG
jgi:hypothetical protein